MWNLGEWYRWSCLQSKNRDTDLEIKHEYGGEKEGCGMDWEIGTDIYTLWYYM